MSWILIIGLLWVGIGGLILFMLNGTIGMDAVTIGTIITALATAVLAIINWGYLQRVDSQIEQNNTNISITKNKILQESYIKETDSIVGPLKSRLGYFKSYEPLYLLETEEAKASEFWDNIKKNKFLAPKDLRVIIEKYLLVKEIQDRELQKIRYEIRQSTNSAQIHEINKLINPAPVNDGYGTYLKNIENAVAEFGHGTDLSNKLNYFHQMSQEGYNYKFSAENESVITSVKSERYDLEIAVKKRYNYLEQKIEELRTEIEKN